MTAPQSKHGIQPNVLFIMADQWGASLLGAAGHPAIQTPTLDALAANGRRFTRAYSESPICIPARRTVMTGTPPRTHGDRVFLPAARMPPLPTLAQCFRQAGYQAYGVGKLHVYPPRDRIGFDDVVLAEEGRPQLGSVDDYDLFLADRGYAGQQFAHGMNNNEYVHRPWHLPEDCHVTTWTTREMARIIKRRDPTRPAFWHLSYCHPHPPLVPLNAYLDLYRDMDINPPIGAPWSAVPDEMPYALRLTHDFWRAWRPAEHLSIRRAFYALCTHIDHQLRLIIGTLREEDLLDDTIIVFTTDHGDMLGDFGLWAKRLFLEGAANVPMIISGLPGDERVGEGVVDNRLVGLQDVMPTLLELAGIDIPPSVEGLSMVGDARRELLYGECREDASATRMLHDGRHKLIWYPAGNRLSLFDLDDDPHEQVDRAGDRAYRPMRAALEESLVQHLYGTDESWIDAGRLVGMPAPVFRSASNRGLSGQRGLHYPQPPVTDPSVPVGMPVRPK